MFDGESAKEYLLINGNLKVTPNHRFYSQGKWIEIGKLKEGDLLLDGQLYYKLLIRLSNLLTALSDRGNISA